MNERVAISVSSSPVSQIGVGGGLGSGEYLVSSRPRISLLPPSSVAPAPTSAAQEYHEAGSRSQQRGLMPMQTEQYCPRPVDIGGLQEGPAFKKIRLAQPQASIQSQNSEVCIKQEHIQLQQPLRIDTRVGEMIDSLFLSIDIFSIFIYITNVVF